MIFIVWWQFSSSNTIQFVLPNAHLEDIHTWLLMIAYMTISPGCNMRLCSARFINVTLSITDLINIIVKKDVQKFSLYQQTNFCKRFKSTHALHFNLNNTDAKWSGKAWHFPVKGWSANERFVIRIPEKYKNE